MNTEPDISCPCRKVTAIIRKELLEQVLERLQQEGVGGLSISEVHGFGEYMDFYRHDWSVTHARVEVFCRREEAERVADAIHDAAVTGIPGDGIIAILPVESLRHNREDGPGA